MPSTRPSRRPSSTPPGDNEWTDCHRPAAGAYYPPERLAFLREVSFPDPDFTTGGTPMPVYSQSRDPRFSDYVETVAWTRSNGVFATLHVVGSNNDLDPWTGIDPTDSYENPRPDRIAEFESRLAATLDWLDRVFRVAERRNSPGVFLFMQANPLFDPTAVGASRRLEDFTRIQTFGTDDVHWVRVTVDPDSANVFELEQQIVDANRFPR